MNNKKINAFPAFGKAGKMGTYTIVMSAILLAALIIVNIIVGLLPTKYTKIDTSANKIYTLSETSVNFVSKLNEKVTLYYIQQNGTENTLMDTFLGRYTDLTSNVRVKVVDPIAEPDFLEKHNASGTSNYSVIVESEKRSKVVDYADFFYYYSEDSGKMSVEEYEYYQQYYGDYFEMYFGTFSEFFAGDSAITGAIEYVTVEKVPTVYLLTGHSEMTFPDVVTENLFEYSEIKYEELNIAFAEIPDDADVIIINNPASDITAEEAEKINAYVNNGGKVFMLTSVTAGGFTNLGKIGTNMGLKANAKMVYESDRSNYTQSQYYLIPEVNSTHEATSTFASSQYSAIIPYAHAIETTGATGVTVTPLLYTSEKAYLDGDTDNKTSYNVAVAAEKGEGKLIWLSSSQAMTETFIYGTNGGNYYVFSTMFSWMQGEYETSLPTIAGIDLSTTYLTVAENSANIWGSILIVIVPGCILAGGLVYWLVRRRK